MSSEYCTSSGKGEQLPMMPPPNGSRIYWSCIRPLYWMALTAIRRKARHKKNDHGIQYLLEFCLRRRRTKSNNNSPCINTWVYNRAHRGSHILRSCTSWFTILSSEIWKRLDGMAVLVFILFGSGSGTKTQPLPHACLSYLRFSRWKAGRWRGGPKRRRTCRGKGTC